MRSKIFASSLAFHGSFMARYANRLRVLAYHTVPDKKAFEKQISYLVQNYNIIGIDQLLDFFEEKKELPRNPLLITFDDGDISVWENALHILKKYKLNSCLFIITKLIDTNEENWFKTVEKNEMNNGKSFLETRKIVGHYKNVNNAERLEEIKKYPPVEKQQLTAEQLHEMEKNGMFIGNHTHTHPMLNKCEVAEIKEEMELAKQVFEKHNLNGYSIFAYPNGNNSAETKKVLKDLGIKLAFLFDHKINEPEIDPLNISRLMVDSNMEINEFKAKVSGIHPFFFNLARKN